MKGKKKEKETAAAAIVPPPPPAAAKPTAPSTTITAFSGTLDVVARKLQIATSITADGDACQFGNNEIGENVRKAHCFVISPNGISIERDSVVDRMSRGREDNGTSGDENGRYE
jgi:hypothetical protein